MLITPKSISTSSPVKWESPIKSATWISTKLLKCCLTSSKPASLLDFPISVDDTSFFQAAQIKKNLRVILDSCLSPHPVNLQTYLECMCYFSSSPLLPLSNHYITALSYDAPGPLAILSFLKYQVSALHINHLRSFPSSCLLLPLSSAQVVFTPGLHISSSFLSLKSLLKCLLLENAFPEHPKIEKDTKNFYHTPLF